MGTSDSYASASLETDQTPQDAPLDGLVMTGVTTGKVFFLARRGLRSLSRAGEPFLGYEVSDLFWKDVFELVHHDDLAALRGRISFAIESPGASSSVEVRLQDADGAWRWVEASVQNVLEGPGDAGLLVVDLHDLTGHCGPEQPVQASYRDALEGLFPYTP